MIVPKPDFPIRGDVVWLTPEQGGRASGPPRTPWDRYFEAAGFVPPETPRTGAVPISLDVAVRDAWVSHAAARWLTAPTPVVDDGSVIVITEDEATVAVFTVRHIERPALDTAPARPLTAQAIAEIEARNDGAASALSPGLAATAPDPQRATEEEGRARLRQDVAALIADLRELRAWYELDEVDAAPDERGPSGPHAPEGSLSTVYVVQTDPDDPGTYQLGAFTDEREAFKALREAQHVSPAQRWVISSIPVWQRFSDYRSDR